MTSPTPLPPLLLGSPLRIIKVPPKVAFRHGPRHQTLRLPSISCIGQTEPARYNSAIDCVAKAWMRRKPC